MIAAKRVNLVDVLHVLAITSSVRTLVRSSATLPHAERAFSPFPRN